MNGGWWRRLDKRLLASMALALLFLVPGTVWGVERLDFEPGFNLFSSQQDVQLGKESAAQVDRNFPLVTEPQVLRYINDLGRRLASLAPNNNSEYAWTFKVLNSSDINAFALPGGYIYVNRGAIVAAENEAQIGRASCRERV